MLKKNKPKLAVFDGNSIVHRAYHALPPTITTRDGKPINAVYGFTSILLKALAELKPTYAIVAWDYPAETFRHKKYESYKATRQKADPELYEQIPLVKKVVETMNVPLLELKGYEADDILGTITEQAQKFKDLDVVLISGDLDILQLVDDNTNVFAMRTGISDVVAYDKTAVKKRYSLNPDQLIDYKALRGDPSDNIPGVKGVGEKTAIKLIENFKSLDQLYKHIEQAQKKGLNEVEYKGLKVSGKLFERLVNNKQNAFLSRELVTIERKVPIKLNLENAELANYDYQKVLALFAELQFKSLVNRLPKVAPIETQSLFKPLSVRSKKIINRKKVAGYYLVDSEEKIRGLVKELSQQKNFAIDSETTILGPMGCELVGLSFCCKPGKAYYVPIGHTASLGPQCTRSRALELLKPLLEDPKIGKYGHNIKYELVVLKNYGINLKPLIFDSMLASYLLNPGRRQNSLDALAFNEFGHEMMPIEECIGVGHKQCSFAEVDLEKATQYSAEDADFTYRLVKPLKEKIKKIPNADKILNDIELPLVPVLAAMEFKGVKVDIKVLTKLAERYKKRIETLKKNIYKLGKGEFNISSPQQLQEVLFKRLGIATAEVKKTKTGYSTAATELEKLQGLHPIIKAISEYRELTKLVSTYVSALPELVEPGTGRVHTSFNQTITATGRLSSSNPNLQNIPVRTEEGNEIRKAFIAKSGHKLVSLDYSQIELRIAAHYSKDPNLLAAFKKGQDVHAATAARVLKKSLDKITKAERNTAKMMNFGVIYGLSAFGLAQRTGLTRAAAQQFIDDYFASYPNLKKYISSALDLARKKGYVETLFGRRRYLPELSSSNWQVRSGAERAAINHPFQGTNADIIKKAMIKMFMRIPETKDTLLMQVHDELIFEIPNQQVAKLSQQFKKIMENVVKISVPIIVEIKTGQNWGELN